MRRLTLLILMIPVCCFSQEKSVRVEGSVETDAGEPLAGCHIAVTRQGSPLLLAFVNTGAANFFSLTVKMNDGDTLLLTASRSGFVTDTTRLTATPLQKKLEIKLTPLAQTLSEVVVKAPPVWKRGDTTFYNVQHFKEGDERKLIDLIKKIPDFRIMENGTLMYKGVVVEKIMIEGQEIFADQVLLLLKSLPQNVLSTIQAIENQNSNPLYKGIINEGKVFVNLGLKKEKKMTVFGDIEAGAGTRKTYGLKPVLFSVHKKLKYGLIADWNKNLEPLGTWDLYQSKSPFLNAAEGGMLSVYNLRRAGDLPDRRFLSNRLANTRLQLSFGNPKKISSQLEFVSVRDRQEQNYFSQGFLLADTGALPDERKIAVRYRPCMTAIKNKTVFNVDSSTRLETDALVECNQTTNDVFLAVRQNSVDYITLNRIRNQFIGAHARAELSKRLSRTKASKFFVQYDRYRLAQEIQGRSPDWWELFGTQDPAYDELKQSLTSHVQGVASGLEYLQRTRKQLWDIRLQAEYLEVEREAPFWLKSSWSGAAPLNLPQFSGETSVRLAKIFTSTSKSFRIGRIPFNAQIKTGMFSIRAKEQKPASSRSALHTMELSSKKALGKNTSTNGSVLFIQAPSDIYKLSGQLFPLGVGEYYRYHDSIMKQKMLNLSFSIFHSTKKMTSLNLSVNATRRYYDYAFNAVPAGLVSVYSNTLVRRPMNSCYLSSDYVFPWMALSSKISLGSVTGINQRLISRQNALSKTNFYHYSLYVGAKRNWNKKLFLTLRSQYTGYVLPKDKKANVKARVSSDISNTLAIRFKAGRMFEASADLQHYMNKFGKGSSSSPGIFSDLRFAFLPPGKKTEFTFRVENLFNETNYFQTSQFSQLLQTTTTLPLVPRRLLLELRYEL